VAQSTLVGQGPGAQNMPSEDISIALMTLLVSVHFANILA